MKWFNLSFTCTPLASINRIFQALHWCCFTSLLWKKVICTYTLSFNGRMGKMLSHSISNFSSKGKNIILQWVFKLNSSPAIAETRHLKGCTLKIQVIFHLFKFFCKPKWKVYNCHFMLFSKFLTHFMLYHNCHFSTLINFLLISFHKWWTEYTILYVVLDGRIGRMTHEWQTAKHVKEPAVA